MKKTIQTISLLLFTMLIIFSCKKANNENVTPTLSTLQHNWTIDSIVVFDNPGFNGGGIKWDGVKGLADYRTDNKVYTQLTGLITVGNQNFTDTASYVYQPEKNIIIMDNIGSGVVSGYSDTTKIFLLNDSHLVTGDISDPGFGYFRKVYAHR